MNVYLPDDQYNALVEALRQAQPTIMQPDIKSVIIELLGEIGGIWPERISDEAA